jgi:sugar/nucleoside kinase (ribokinase family)
VSAPVALVVGHATLDRAGGELVPGGSVFYAAHALAALGAQVRVLTAAGPDLPADTFRFRAAPTATATATGSIDALVLPSPATTLFENVYGADGRRTQRVLAAARPLRAEDLPAHWRDADLLLLAPVLGELDPGAFARAVRARAAGLCVQGLVREVRPDGSVVPRTLEPTPPSLPGIAVAVLGEDEAAGQPGLPEALAAAVPLVAFTRGARGCDLLRAGRRPHQVGVHRTTEVDPTGAGDVFAAALLLALARGDDPVQAARLGAAAASIVVEGRGGATLDRVGEAWARAGWVEVG